MYAVKLLVAGDPPPSPAVEKGDVIEVIPSTCDWGSKTVALSWIRLNVTNVPAASQQLAEDKARKWLTNWRSGMTILEIPGAVLGQRYRIEAIPELANDFNQTEKVNIRDQILVSTLGLLVNQGSNFFEFDSTVDMEDVIRDVLDEINYRRFRFPSPLVDQVLASVIDGEAKEVTKSYPMVFGLVVDKLRS